MSPEESNQLLHHIVQHELLEDGVEVSKDAVAELFEEENADTIRMCKNHWSYRRDVVNPRFKRKLACA